jgi:hypothetical protein
MLYLGLCSQAPKLVPGNFLFVSSTVQEVVEKSEIGASGLKPPAASGVAIHRIHSCGFPLHQKAALTFLFLGFKFLPVDG